MMHPARNLQPLCAAALALLLSSCTTWQLGERLEAPYTTYTGLDIEQPADGKIYHAPMRAREAASGKLSETCYVLAPEVDYYLAPQLTYDASGLNPKPAPEVAGLQPTGRVVPVRLRRDELGNYRFERALPALPKGLVAEDAAISPLLTQARENAQNLKRTF